MVAGLFSLYGGIAFIVIGAQHIIRYKKALKEGYHTKAEIVAVKPNTGPQRRETHVTVEFIDSEGQPRQVTYNGGGIFYVGESVQISFYNNEAYQLDGTEGIGGWIGLILGCGLAIIGLIVLVMGGTQ